MPNETIKLIIRGREGTVFEGEVYAVSSINGKGPFDILPHHAEFISLIERQVTVHHSDGHQQVFKIDSGVIEVDENQIKIYLENYTPTWPTLFHSATVNVEMFFFDKVNLPNM